MIAATQAKEYSTNSSESGQAIRHAKYMEHIDQAIVKRSQNGWTHTTLSIDDDLQGAEKVVAELVALGYNVATLTDETKYKVTIRVTW